MDKSESIKELASALAKAQGQIKGALKDAKNPFFNSKYADLASVVEAVRQPLSGNGLSYTQIAHDSENSAKIETVILHSSGEWLSCGCVSVPVSKEDAQGFGSAMTYARRYGLSAAFGVAPEDDDGVAAGKAAPKETPGQLVDQELASEGIPPETLKRLREEAVLIAKDFTEVGAKAALGSYTAFKKASSVEEQNALWSFLPSEVRSGIKKAGAKETT